MKDFKALYYFIQYESIYCHVYLLNKLEFHLRKEKELPSLPDFSLYNKTKTEYKINEAGSGYDGPVTCPYSNEWFFTSFRSKTRSNITVII